MPRGPFQGTFLPNLRPTVVHAPDALVYINGESDVIGCPTCRRKFDINRYITQISVDLGIDSVPGSATINLSVPRHTTDDLYFEGVPVITSMMEVEIYAKGYFLVEGVPQYYPIFWGLTTEVSDSFSSGETTLSINCSDILKWWEMCRMNINPAFTGASGQAGRSIFGNVFFGKNPYDVIWTIAQQAFGDVVVGSGSLVSLLKEKGGQSPVFQQALGDIMSYWEQRFGRIRSNLLLYGVNGVAVRGDALYEAQKSDRGKTGEPFASTAVANANGGKWGGQMTFNPADPSVVAFRTDFGQAGQINFWQSEYQTKLELATAAKEAIGFEFYMDVTGDIVFKPPFFNVDIIENKPLSWIQDIDIIDYDFSDSEAEVVTQIQMQGNYGGSVDFGLPQETTPFTSVTDYHLLRKYGWRPQPYNSEFMGDPQLMFYHGMDILDRLNSRRHRATVSIPLRPELRLGFPIYVVPKDQIWYIQGISHNISMGGRAQTTLTLTARRQKFVAPRGISKLSFNGMTKGEETVNVTTRSSSGKVEVKKETRPLQPKGSNYRWSSKQLSEYGKFNLVLGASATMPPTTDALSSIQGDNPYEALILRHPKTGRVMGFPNVALAYTRPFNAPPDELAALAGQKKKGANPYVSPGDKKQVEERYDALAERIQSQHTVSDIDGIVSGHLNNRFTYGLNSAGVFVYAHDADKVIQEALFIKSSNLTTTSGDNSPFAGILEQSTALIRPISDERGFEHIGHFRYGRGITLRDGQLIVNGPVIQAEIRQSLAIGGDLFSTLSAQSAGLTTLQVASLNPADTVARLHPDELQTGAFQTPGMDKPKFSSTATNFIDQSVLGDGKDKGYAVSVEAGQLSRALTLAELTPVKGARSSSDVKCPCLLTRSDLAFMNTGYQVKILRSTASDESTLANSNGAVDTLALEEGSPVFQEDAVSALDHTDAITVVNDYLFNLYRVLDQAHQEVEKTYRGEYLNIEQPTIQDRLVQPPKPGIAPPFSPANRFEVGDPAAIAAQAESSLDNLSTTWNNFSDNLQANRDRTYFTESAKKDQAELDKVVEELKHINLLIAEIAEGRVTVVQVAGAPSLSEQKASLEKERDRLTQSVADNNLKAAQVRNP